MSLLLIPTPRLNLVLQSPDEVLAMIERLSPADRAEVSPEWLARMQTTQPGDYWRLSFSAVLRSSGTEVGNCSFKGPPNSEGAVELAYYVHEPLRGQGYATEAAAGLTDFALADPQVRNVLAHTRPDNGASHRVLTKCGFTQVGECIDPEDGLVWRWERATPA